MTDHDPDIVDDIAERIRDAGLASPTEIEGCSEGEIQRIERECMVELPIVYRSFLRQVGKSSGSFLQGFVCHYPRILREQATARRLFQRADTDSELGRTEFVFVGSQGVTFFYFDVRDPDPPVSLVAEGHGDPQQFSESFSAWVEEMLTLQTEGE